MSLQPITEHVWQVYRGFAANFAAECILRHGLSCIAQCSLSLAMCGTVESLDELV